MDSKAQQDNSNRQNSESRDKNKSAPQKNQKKSKLKRISLCVEIGFAGKHAGTSAIKVWERTEQNKKVEIKVNGQYSIHMYYFIHDIVQ